MAGEPRERLGMAKRGKESFIRRQKEISRQQRQKDKAAERKEKRSQEKKPGAAAGELSPDDLVTVDELVGIAAPEKPDSEPGSTGGAGGPATEGV